MQYQDIQGIFLKLFKMIQFRFRKKNQNIKFLDMQDIFLLKKVKICLEKHMGKLHILYLQVNTIKDKMFLLKKDIPVCNKIHMWINRKYYKELLLKQLEFQIINLNMLQNRTRFRIISSGDRMKIKIKKSKLSNSRYKDNKLLELINLNHMQIM